MDDFRLKVFITAARTLSFTRTAERLFISQPAVSKHIGELESQYKVQLFVRRGSRLELTGAGETLLACAERLADDYRRLEYEMSLCANQAEGELRLGIADGTENYVPLGQPDMLEHPQPGEVIYYDTATKDVFCRAWCWKNGNRSKLMPETTNAVINVDAMPPLPLATAEQAAEEVAGLLRRFTGAKTAIHKLTAETPRFTL